MKRFKLDDSKQDDRDKASEPEDDKRRSFPSRTDGRPARSRYRDGYRFPPEARALMRGWLRTNPIVSVATALGDHLTILLCAAAHISICHASASPAIAATTYIPVAILIARALRGLECLTHEGAHRNFWRERPAGNDLLVNALAAFPTGSRATAFRADHAKHHNLLGTSSDPCWQRYRHLDLEGLDRGSPFGYALGASKRLVPYIGGWWAGPSGIGWRSIAYALAWHAAFVIAPLTLLVEIRSALFIWLAYFAVPFGFVLPPLRLCAEAGKHDYEHNDATVFGATFENVGLVHVLLHPHGDRFHLLHHLHPAIPHHRIRAVHRCLLANDPNYACGRRRTGILDAPDLPAVTELRS